MSLSLTTATYQVIKTFRWFFLNLRHFFRGHGSMVRASRCSVFYFRELVVILLSLIVRDAWANNRMLMLIVIHSLSSSKRNRFCTSLPSKFSPYSLLILKLKHSFSLFVFFLLPIFLFNLFLKRISYRLLWVFLLLDEDWFFISALEYRSSLL